VFELNGETWVTRFKQRDAICLDNRAKRIDIAVESPHDGLICGNRIYFTTVDGRIVIAHRRTLQVDEIVDLKKINGKDALLAGAAACCRSMRKESGLDSRACEKPNSVKTSCGSSMPFVRG
jgi:hypothetical protein